MHLQHPTCISIAGTYRRSMADASLDRWPEIRDELRTLYQATVATALQLIHWVRQQVENFRNATLPVVIAREARPRNKLLVEVSLAGRLETRELTDAQASFLADLAKNGSAACYRRDKLELVTKLPELSRHIAPVPGEDPGGNRARYRIAPEMQPRIDIAARM